MKSRNKEEFIKRKGYLWYIEGVTSNLSLEAKQLSSVYLQFNPNNNCYYLSHYFSINKAGKQEVKNNESHEGIRQFMINNLKKPYIFFRQGGEYDI